MQDKLRKWLSPERRVAGSIVLLFVCIVAWPVTALTVFREEPQGILGLSFLALILTLVDIVINTDIRKEQD